MKTHDVHAKYPSSSTGFEWLMGLVAVVLVGGLSLDQWAHRHAGSGSSLLRWDTAAHATLALIVLILIAVAARNVSRHYAVWRSLPSGYGLSLLGVLVLILGGMFSLISHAGFATEDIQGMLSPAHVFFTLAAALIITGPIRSAVVRISASTPAAWMTHGPLVLSLAAAVALFGFTTKWAHPLYAAFGASDMRPPILGAIYVTKIDGSRQTRLLFDPTHDVWSAAVSPDGKRIAYRRENQGILTSDIFVANFDGSNAHRITHSGRHDTQPAWSPDGREVAYISEPATSGDSMLRVVAATGGQPSTLVAGAAVLSGASWSPDGRAIAFGSRRGQRDWIATVAPQGGAVSWLSAGADGSWPAWRLDGNAIAFVRNQNSDAAIYMVDAQGVNRHRVSRPGEDARSPAWSPDGRQIAFTSWRNKTLQVYVMNSDGTGDVAVSRDSGLFSDRPAWAPDDEIIFAASQQRAYDPTQDQALGVASFLLQTILLMGMLLLLVRRWRVPPGALTVILALSGFAMLVASDQLFILPWIVGSGLIADAYILLLGARIADGAAFYLFGFGFPVVFVALFEAAVALTLGRGWAAPTLLGVALMCGLAGLLLAYILRTASSMQGNALADVGTRPQ